MLSEDSVVLAVVIGDGYIDKQGRIWLKHSITQRKYAEWKEQLLQEKGFKTKSKVIPKREGSFSTNDDFSVNCSVTARGKRLREFFYNSGQKRVPEGVFDKFGWFEWSILYQDDGRQNKIAHYNTIQNGKRVRVECDPFVNRYEFCFPKFTDEEMDAAIRSLANLGIEARTGWHRKLGQRLLWITKSEAKQRFYLGVRDRLIPMMRYKMSAKPAMGYTEKENKSWLWDKPSVPFQNPA